MNVKRKLIGLLILVLEAAVVFVSLPYMKGWIRYYDRWFYYPYQNLRGMLFAWLPFSLGDVLYVLGGLWLVVTLFKWGKYILGYREYGDLLYLSMIKTAKGIVGVYLLFVIGWGANYYKPGLAAVWQLVPERQKDTTDSGNVLDRRAAQRQQVRTGLTLFGRFLTERLNEYAPYYLARNLKQINRNANLYYQRFTDSRVSGRGLEIKPTLFGYFLQRTGIEGYYNPFTGEGQIDGELPAFTMPFLICHEMAHQAGIAAEEDANLLAYAVCTACPDSTFRYSAYLNLWLYTNNRLFRLDSVMAKADEAMLNKLTLAQLDTLEQLAKLYRNEYARASTKVFDSYLKMQDQKDGVRSYGNVSLSAWAYEQKRVVGEVIRVR